MALERFNSMKEMFSNTLMLFPLIVDEIFEVLIVKLGWLRGPGELEPTGPGTIRLHSGALSFPRIDIIIFRWFPRATLRLPIRSMTTVAGTVTLAHRVAAAHQGHRLCVVHIHPLEDIPDRHNNIQSQTSNLFLIKQKLLSTPYLPPPSPLKYQPSIISRSGSKSK